jgi:predicted amidohydrolase
MRGLSVSLIQMDMALNDRDGNYSLAESLILADAKIRKSDVYVLPETWNLGFAPSSVAASLSDPEGRQTIELMSRLSSRLGVNIVAGSVVTSRDSRLCNTGYVFDRTGNVIASYDKTHLFSPMGEDKVFAKGSGLCRFSLDGLKCALIICYDIRFCELVRTLALDGLDVLFVVSQWPEARKDHLLTLARARAIENQMFVVLCNSPGTAGKVKYAGLSSVFDPWGNLLAQAGPDQQTLHAELDAAELDKIRSSIPVFADRRPELYDVDR